MGARLKDFGLGMVAAGWLAAATWMTPAGDVPAAPSGETLPTMCWIRATTGHECPTCGPCGPCGPCGMSRSFVAFFHGEIGHTFQFHPVGPVLAAVTVMVLVSVLGLAISGRRPLWGRPVFARALTLSAVGALFAGVVRMLVGGLG